MIDSIKIKKIIIPFHSIKAVDCSKMEDLIVSVQLHDGTIHQAENIEAIELMMALKPSVIEGSRMFYAKFAWFVHNMFGHPIMQLLSLFGWYKLAFWVHDATVPKPRVK